MATMEQFARNIRVRGRNVETNTDLLVRRAALLVDQAIVLATPVDTGRARSNWRVSLGVSVPGVIEPYSPGKKLGLGEGANAAAAISQAKTQILRRRNGQNIYITNNVLYIGDLNDGTSSQAGSNFVEKAIMAGVSSIRGARVVK